MGIGTSDGMVYDDDLQYHLGEPSARITVHPTSQREHAVELDPVDGTFSGPTRFDDTATVGQRFRDMDNPEIPHYQRLKDAEFEFEQRNNAGEGTMPPVIDAQQIADKPFDKAKNFNDASNILALTKQEKNLYQYHLNNLTGSGGVDNPDGSRSTVKGMTVEMDGKTYVIPSIYKGKELTTDQAIENAKRIGIDSFPSYDQQDLADIRYRAIHDYFDKDVKDLQDYRKSSKPSNQNPWDTLMPKSMASKTGIKNIEDLTDEEWQGLRGHTKNLGGRDETADQIIEDVNGQGIPLRYGEHHPGIQELMKRNPDDVDIIRLNEFGGKYDKEFSDETVIVVPKRKPALTSSLQIDRTGGDINFLMNDETKVAAGDDSIANLGLNAFHRFIGELQQQHEQQQDRRVELSRDLMEEEHNRQPLTQRGLNDYRRELRRSPADGTFRNTNSMNTDWEGFNSVRVQRQAPSGWSHVEGGGEDYRGRMSEPDGLGMNSRPRNEVAQGYSLNERDQPQRGRVKFETDTGKKGTMAFTYYPDNKEIHVSWMGANGGFGGKNAIEPHELGLAKTRQILKAVAQQYPEAELVTASRVTGARKAAGADSSLNMKIPSSWRKESKSTPSTGSTTNAIAGAIGNAHVNAPGSGPGWAAPGTRLTDLW